MQKDKEVLKLPLTFTFWYQQFVKGENRFEDSLHPVASIDTVQAFWHYYQHFNRPSTMKSGSYIYLFKQNVKPVWEDQHNQKGGAFVLRFEKTKTNRIWEDILLGFISAKEDVLQYLNGVRIKIKKDFAQIDLWISNVSDEKVLEFYRQWIIKITTLENDTPLQVIRFSSQQ